MQDYIEHNNTPIHLLQRVSNPIPVHMLISHYTCFQQHPISILTINKHSVENCVVQWCETLEQEESGYGRENNPIRSENYFSTSNKHPNKATIL